MDIKKGWVSGRVQGVGFRYFTQQMAESLGLEGYAKNLSDGRVEVLLSGPASRITKAQQALAQGPELAHVTSVEWVDIDTEATLTGFTVL